MPTTATQQQTSPFDDDYKPDEHEIRRARISEMCEALKDKSERPTTSDAEIVRLAWLVLSEARLLRTLS